MGKEESEEGFNLQGNDQTNDQIISEEFDIQQSNSP
jgi:hypothetical protein